MSGDPVVREAVLQDLRKLVSRGASPERARSLKTISSLPATQMMITGPEPMNEGAAVLAVVTDGISRIDDAISFSWHKEPIGPGFVHQALEHLLGPGAQSTPVEERRDRARESVRFFGSTQNWPRAGGGEEQLLRVLAEAIVSGRPRFTGDDGKGVGDFFLHLWSHHEYLFDARGTLHTLRISGEIQSRREVLERIDTTVLNVHPERGVLDLNFAVNHGVTSWEYSEEDPGRLVVQLTLTEPVTFGLSHPIGYSYSIGADRPRGMYQVAEVEMLDLTVTAVFPPDTSVVPVVGWWFSELVTARLPGKPTSDNTIVPTKDADGNTLFTKRFKPKHGYYYGQGWDWSN